MLEDDLRQLLIDSEKLIDCIQVGRWGDRRALVLTSGRVILFERKFGGRLREVSDKQWRQLIKVHLDEGFFRSTLRLSFFSHHDSIALHDPRHSRNMEARHWELDHIVKEEARRAYTVLKAKEQEWKDRRLTEQIEREKATRGLRLDVDRIIERETPTE